MDSPIVLDPPAIAIVIGAYFVMCAFVAGWATALWLQESRTEVDYPVKESEKKQKLSEMRAELQKATTLMRQLIQLLEAVSKNLSDLERKN